MIERFLRYSLRWRCPVKLVILEGDDIKTLNATVVSLSPERVSLITARNKKTPRELPLCAVLAAGYARGDDGDTSKKRRAEEGDA